VDSIAKQCVILVDQTKVVPELGLTFPVPVEVLQFALSPVLRALVGLGGGNNTSLDLLSLQYLVLLLLLGPAELKPVGSHGSFHHRFPC
jgi:hypothetical protein